jgi:hypothetical protein
MKLPHLGNLDNFVKKATIGSTPSISVNRSDAQHMVKEYLNLVNYVMSLQDRVIELERELATPQQIEIVSNKF